MNKEVTVNQITETDIALLYLETKAWLQKEWIKSDYETEPRKKYFNRLLDLIVIHDIQKQTLEIAKDALTDCRSKLDNDFGVSAVGDSFHKLTPAIRAINRALGIIEDGGRATVSIPHDGTGYIEE